MSVREAELSMRRRFGASEDHIIIAQSNLAITYGELGQMEKALGMERDVYSGRLELSGEEHPLTLQAAYNYTGSLIQLRRHKEAKSVLRRTMPVARRVFGESHEVTLRMRKAYAVALYGDDGATLDDLREAETTLEDTEPIARRVLGGAHPLVAKLESNLRYARAALAAREVSSISEAFAAMTPRDAQDDPSS